MNVNVLVPSTDQPSGGVLGIVEFANGLARRGHEVHLFHLPFLGRRIESVADLSWWCPIEPEIVHHVVDDIVGIPMPRAQFTLCFDARVPRTGLPLTFLQAFQILPPEVEDAILSPPGPLLCTSSWLRRLAIGRGLPAHRVFHLPYGIRHEKYGLSNPIEGRPRRVALLYNSHPLKDAEVGVAALELAKREVPDLEAVVFSTTGTVRQLPGWMEYRASPPQQALVHEVYNGSRIFLSPAIAEGFGLAAVESMACGCALVTTDNGGSEDYARDGDTALVTPTRDIEAMAGAIIRAATDDGLCQSIASKGRDVALSFDWDRSAAILEDILLQCSAQPSAFLAAGERVTRR